MLGIQILCSSNTCEETRSYNRLKSLEFDVKRRQAFVATAEQFYVGQHSTQHNDNVAFVPVQILIQLLSICVPYASAHQLPPLCALSLLCTVITFDFICLCTFSTACGGNIRHRLSPHLAVLSFFWNVFDVVFVVCTSDPFQTVAAVLYPTHTDYVPCFRRHLLTFA